MSTETNKAIVRRYIEQVWNEGRLDLLEEFFVEDVVTNGIPPVPGLEGLGLVKNGVTRNRTAFPDLQIDVQDFIAEGDKVVQRYTASGTHQGELQGFPPSGKPVAFSGVGIFRLDNGRIVEVWNFADSLGLMQQLGAIPSPDSAV
jgi:steroid delta-isomerase-like uncharacterized protein